ncbi:PE-PGRS family protein PE_PGRS26-like [Palaemon carinicauda]|uniref:PE-PGRS family protein PE_PGRS26-like n=1 Tax=Palaemon carinicauda TaxID=392227 RepID=UPI0035B595BD
MTARSEQRPQLLYTATGAPSPPASTATTTPATPQGGVAGGGGGGGNGSCDGGGSLKPEKADGVASPKKVEGSGDGEMGKLSPAEDIDVEAKGDGGGIRAAVVAAAGGGGGGGGGGGVAAGSVAVKGSTTPAGEEGPEKASSPSSAPSAPPPQHHFHLVKQEAMEKDSPDGDKEQGRASITPPKAFALIRTTNTKLSHLM